MSKLTNLIVQESYIKSMPIDKGKAIRLYN